VWTKYEASKFPQDTHTLLAHTVVQS
jgi:hypothetical protein